MTLPNSIVFLVDVDNTLLDNDRIQSDIKRHLDRDFGVACRERYWTILEQLFTDLGYRDYLGALQRFRVEHPRDAHLLSMSSFLVDYPFANRLYPGSLDVLERFRAWGQTVILSYGDVVFQPRKIERSGISFRPIYDRTNGVDGWVSLEVSPLLAHDTASTLAAAKSLHARAGRPNLFIEIPGTEEGLPAIEEAIFAGVPVNVTLLFSRETVRNFEEASS
jgi:Transaldolase/Fructose-6-phosphate aldolase